MTPYFFGGFLEIFLTYCLILPYLMVLAYFYLYEKDNYFYGVRGSVQLLLVLFLIGVFLIDVIIWKTFFIDYNFLNFSLKAKVGTTKTTALVTMLSATAAVSGWVFTSRVQIVNATKTHAMQALMNSRNSTVYIQKVEEAMKIRHKLKEKNGLGVNDLVVMSREEYNELTPEERGAIHYMLNFLEFIAVGVRHNNMDEELIKGSLESILRNNYILFQQVIEYVREISPKNYTELETLYKRWNNYNSDKCIECKNWFEVDEDIKDRKKPARNSLYTLMSIATLFVWNISITIIDYIKRRLRSRTIDDHICKKCNKNSS